MSISKIRLRNFRGFRNASLDLAPLTVLLGPNSSGKSSFSHPLAAISHCQKLYTGRRDASLSPRTAKEADEWPIDLGSYSDLVTFGSKEKVYIDLLTSEGWIEFGFGGLPSLPNDLCLSHIGTPQNLDVITSVAQSPVTTKLEVPKEGSFQTAVNVDPRAFADLSRPMLTLVRTSEQEWQHDGQQAIVGLDGLIPVSLQHSSGTPFKLNAKSISEIQLLFKDMGYLRANRKRPTRGFEYSRTERRSVGYSGEKAASVLFNVGSEIAVYVCPPQQAESAQPVQWSEKEVSLQKAVTQWLDYLRLAARMAASESVRYGSEYIDVRIGLNSNGQTRDLTEVGYGLSQVIPVIVGALLQPRGSIFIVDLPEGHLHPRPQAAIADLFCALAMSGRTTVVETHSEMFFHRLRLRAASQPELMERIAVYFVDGPDSDGICNSPRRVGLRLDEEVKWPPGFLQETLDAELQIRLAREASRQHD